MSDVSPGLRSVVETTHDGETNGETDAPAGCYDQECRRGVVPDNIIDMRTKGLKMRFNQLESALNIRRDIKYQEHQVSKYIVTFI